MSGAIEVFCSYARKDERLRDQLERHLSPLRNEGLILPFFDRTIGPGSEWENEINEHIASAQIILLLVSANFLTSEYCQGVEVRRAIDRHHSGEALVVPIILQPCDWCHTPFAKLQALPEGAKPVTDWSNRDKAYTQIAIHIRTVVDKLRRQRDTSPKGAQLQHPEQRRVGRSGQRTLGGNSKLTVDIWPGNSEPPFKILRTYEATLDYLEVLVRDSCKQIWTVRTHAGQAAAELHLFEVLLARLSDRNRRIQEVRRNIRLVNSEGTRDHLYWLIDNFSELIPAKVRYFNGTGPRFDFIIVDRSKAVLGLPMAAGEGVDISIVVEDLDVVRCLEQAFEDLWTSSTRLFNGVPGTSPANKLKLKKHIDRQLHRLGHGRESSD